MFCVIKNQKKEIKQEILYKTLGNHSGALKLTWRNHVDSPVRSGNDVITHRACCKDLLSPHKHSNFTFTFLNIYQSQVHAAFRPGKQPCCSGQEGIVPFSGISLIGRVFSHHLLNSSSSKFSWCVSQQALVYIKHSDQKYVKLLDQLIASRSCPCLLCPRKLVLKGSANRYILDETLYKHTLSFPLFNVNVEV